MGEADRVVPGSYRSATPRAVWLTNYGETYRPGILIAWRRQRLPSVADRNTYWFGLVVQARTYHERIETIADWVWEPHILPVPEGPEATALAYRQKNAKSSSAAPHRDRS